MQPLVIALYDYAAGQQGDLSMEVDDIILVSVRTLALPTAALQHNL